MQSTAFTRQAPCLGRAVPWRAVRPTRAVAACAEVAVGGKVKVVSDIKVYHVPGFKTGLDMKGKEGVVDSNVILYKGVPLSPNMPWKVQFQVENKGKMKTFFVHLVAEELEKA